MSIYARKYKPSKWEPIVFADKLDDMFTDFAARDFGIKNMNRLVRSQYVTHRFNDDDYAFYFAILNEHKRHVRENVNLLTQQRKHMIELFERLFNKQVRIHKHKMIITETA